MLYEVITIAMVFQNYALYPHMTVYENMAFALKLRKTPKQEIKERVTEAARILDIEHLLNRRPKALSGGQRQRVALGRAMVRHPKVFLLDEPLSNLDAKLRTQMRSEISKLHLDLGTTFVYVTHDQTEAMTMGDRIVVMKDGFIQQVDTPSNLYQYPCNLFVAGFIGSPQMNFFDGELIKEDALVITSYSIHYTKLYELFRSSEDVEESANWNRRNRENLEKMKSGNVFEIASVIKSLLKREMQKNLSSSEKKMLGTSMQILVSELALASNKKDEEVRKIITQVL